MGSTDSEFIVTGVFSYILLTFVSPELVDMMVQQQYDEMLESGMQADQAREAMKIAEILMIPAVIGVIAGVLGSIFFRYLGTHSRRNKQNQGICGYIDCCSSVQ